MNRQNRFTNFSRLKSSNKYNPRLLKRINQRDVLPAALKLRLTEFYDSKNRAIIIPSYINTLTYGNQVNGLIKELQLPILSGGTSGGDIASYYTDGTVWLNLDASEFQLNPGDYKNCSIQLEVTYRCGVAGDPTRNIEVHLYDVTNDTIVSNSSIIANGQQALSGAGSYPVERSADFYSDLSSGTHDYVLRYRSGTSGLFVDIYFVKLIIRF